MKSINKNLQDKFKEIFKRPSKSNDKNKIIKSKRESHKL